MKRVIGILAGFLVNALFSAVIGLLVAVAIALAQEESVLPLVFAGKCAAIGLLCGTASKTAIEGTYHLIGGRRLPAYLVNAVVVAVVIVAGVHLLFGDFSGIGPWAMALIFALPEAASLLLVRASLNEADRLERAMDDRRKALEMEEGE
jgi:hypothetical protein